MINSPAGSGDERPCSTEFRDWLAFTPAMVHAIDAQNRILYVSDAWLEKLGYARAEVIGKQVFDFLNPEARDHAIRNLMPEFIRSGRCENVEGQIVHKDGRVLDILLSGRLYSNAAQGISQALFAITDVTAYRTAGQLPGERDTLYRQLVENQPEIVSVWSVKGEYQLVNHAYARLCGKQPDEFAGNTIFDFLRPEDHAAAAALPDILSAENPVATSESQMWLPNHQTRWISWTHRALLDSRGQLTGIHSVGRDIEDRMTAHRRLMESEARYRLLAENSTDMVLQIGLDLAWHYVSPACHDLLGYNPEELAGTRAGQLSHSDDSIRVRDLFATLVDGRCSRQTLISRLRHRNGHWIWVEGHFQAIRDPATGAITGLSGAVRDISVQKNMEDQLAEANRRLEALAREDSLTQLHNRRAFDQRLAKEYRRAMRDETHIGLVMIDVDRFKSFNDSYGHTMGDACLRKIGDAIKATIGRPGDMAARYGGEEFAVLLPGTDENGAAFVAEKIRKAILDLAISHDASPQGAVTVSAGVAAAGPGEFEHKPVLLIDRADRALYHAKANDRNMTIRASSLIQAAAGRSTAAA